MEDKTMSKHFKLPALVLAGALAMGHGVTAAQAACSTMIGYGQAPVRLTAADQARNSLWHQARSRFGATGSYGRVVSKMLNYQSTCHTSRKSGQTIYHCRASGALCSSDDLGIGKGKLPYSRLGY